MTAWQLFSIIGAVGAAMALFAWIFHSNTWSDQWGGWWVALCCTGTFLVLFAVVAVAIIYGNRAAGRNSCAAFAHTSGYTTRFAIIGPGGTGTCLVRTDQGRWIPQDNLQYVKLQHGK